MFFVADVVKNVDAHTSLLNVEWVMVAVCADSECSHKGRRLSCCASLIDSTALGIVMIPVLLVRKSLLRGVSTEQWSVLVLPTLTQLVWVADRYV